MLDDDLGLLGDVRRVQVDEAGQRRGRLALVQIGVVGDLLGQLEEAAVGRVALEHIEDEALLDGLAHGVQVVGGWLSVRPLVPEHLQRLELGRRRERKEAHVRLRPPKERRTKGELVGGREVLGLLLELRREARVAQELLDLHRHLARLRAVGLGGHLQPAHPRPACAPLTSHAAR